MKILIVGNGGREHALALSCRNGAGVSEVLVAPGNAGTAQRSAHAQRRRRRQRHRGAPAPGAG